MKMMSVTFLIVFSLMPFMGHAVSPKANVETNTHRIRKHLVSTAKSLWTQRQCILHSLPHNLSEDMNVIAKGKKLRVVKAQGDWYKEIQSGQSEGYINGSCFE